MTRKSKGNNIITLQYITFIKGFFLPTFFRTFRVFKPLFKIWSSFRWILPDGKTFLQAHERPFRAEWWTCLLFKMFVNSGCTHVKLSDWETPTLINKYNSSKNKATKQQNGKDLSRLKFFIVIVQENKTVPLVERGARTHTHTHTHSINQSINLSNVTTDEREDSEPLLFGKNLMNKLSLLTGWSPNQRTQFCYTQTVPKSTNTFHVH